MEKVLEDNSKWSKASIRISGDTLRPEEISMELDLKATRSGLKGERLEGSPRMRPLRNSVWILNSPLDNQYPLENHLEWLLDALEPKLEVINGIARKYETDFFCGFSSENGQGGCNLSTALLQRLAKTGVPLVLDLYPPGPIDLDLNQE